jgi:hypothetical protein
MPHTTVCRARDIHPIRLVYVMIACGRLSSGALESARQCQSTRLLCKTYSLYREGNPWPVSLRRPLHVEGMRA